MLVCCAGEAGHIGGTRTPRCTATCREPTRLQGEHSCLWTCRKSLPGGYIAYKLLAIFCLFVFIGGGFFFLLLLPNLFKIFIYFILCFRTPMERLLAGGRLGTRCRWAGSLPAAGRFQSAGPCREAVPAAAARGRHVRATCALVLLPQLCPHSRAEGWGSSSCCSKACLVTFFLFPQAERMSDGKCTV